ncbi:MAG: ImmA/IrrE family metallo-endopeptidase [Thermales bacterium]|nr:ImmA/IrrE family metallo-endopeptidase [Thermales bacterium]
MKPEIKSYIDTTVNEKYYVHGKLDLNLLCKDLGIHVYEVEFLDEGISGAIQKSKSDNWEIFVNRAHHINRKRFTVAHEIGHYISYYTTHIQKYIID